MAKRILLLAIVLPVLTLAVACSKSPEVLKQEYLQKGDKALEASDFAAAVVQYRNAVKADKSFGHARYQLARAYEGLGDFKNALSEYVRAADLMPDDQDAQLAAARNLLRSGQFEDARTRAEMVLKRNPKSAEAHLVRGRAAAGMRDFDDANSAFKDGLKEVPRNSDFYVSLGLLSTQQGKAAEAEASFKQAIAVAPDKPEPHLSLADFYWSQGRLDKAEEELRRGVELDKSGEVSNRMLALFLIATGRQPEAEQPLRLAAEGSKQPRIRLALADYYLTNKQPDMATKVLDDLDSVKELSSLITVRRAEIELAGGKNSRALQILDEHLKSTPNDPDLLYAKTQLLVKEGKPAEAIVVARSTTKANPDGWRGHELQGTVALSLKLYDEATTAFRESLRLSPSNTTAMIYLSQLALRQGKSDDGVRLAEQATGTDPRSGAARFTLVNALIEANNPTRALREAQGLSHDDARVQVSLARIQRLLNNDAAARQAYERALALNKSSVDAVAGLAELELKGGQTARAVSRATELLTAQPKEATANLVAARAFAAAGEMSKAEASARQAIVLDPSLRPAYDFLGGIYRKQNRVGEAQKLFAKLSAEQPKDIPARTMSAILLLASGRMDEARAGFEEVLSIDPRAAIASNNLAYFDAEAGTNLDMALNRAQTAKAALPDDPEVDDTLGWIYVKKGLPALALNPLEQATKKDPQNALYHFHLGTAQVRSGNDSAARSSFQQVLNLSPGSREAAQAKTALQSLSR